MSSSTTTAQQLKIATIAACGLYACYYLYTNPIHWSLGGSADALTGQQDHMLDYNTLQAAYNQNPSSSAASPPKPDTRRAPPVFQDDIAEQAQTLQSVYGEAYPNATLPPGDFAAPPAALPFVAQDRLSEPSTNVASTDVTAATAATGALGRANDSAGVAACKAAKCRGSKGLKRERCFRNCEKRPQGIEVTSYGNSVDFLRPLVKAPTYSDTQENSFWGPR